MSHLSKDDILKIYKPLTKEERYNNMIESVKNMKPFTDEDSVKIVKR